jgi:hypothetical protein
MMHDLGAARAFIVAKVSPLGELVREFAMLMISHRSHSSSFCGQGMPVGGNGRAEQPRHGLT